MLTNLSNIIHLSCQKLTIHKDYMIIKASTGEKITNDSWLVRDSWKTTDVKYGAKASFATNPSL
jgi:hypothetical protein